MGVPLEIDGLEGHRLEVHMPAFLQGPRLTLDGRPAPRGKGRSVYEVQRPDGRTVTIRLRPSLVYDYPAVEVDGIRRELVPPLRWYQYLLSIVPLVLILGGLLGILLALVVFLVNIRVWRSEIPVPARYLLVATLSIGLPLLYFLTTIFLAFLLEGV